MWQCIFSLSFNFFETSVFDFCYEPDSNAEANSALLSNLIACSFSPVTPSMAQKSILGSEISRKYMFKWIALNFVHSYIYFTFKYMLYIYILQNTEFRISEFHLSLADEYTAKCFG